MKILYCIALCLAFQGAGSLAGQEILHKASGTDERSFTKGISMITVFGEKASVTIKGWSSSEVKVLLRPVARNRNRDQAIADLKYIRYSAETEGNKLVVRNSFKGQMEQITSNLTMEIEIYMPHSVPAEITNLYGPVDIMNLNTVTAIVSFGSLKVDKISSECMITTRYTDMELSSIRGVLVVNAEKSDILTTDLNASTTINCSYGEAAIGLAGKGPFTVRGYRTAIEINVENFENYSYNLKAPHGRVLLPEGEEAGSEAVELTHRAPAGLIDVSTSYCDITISTK
ncbi:MAG TPA: hypothetical protein PKJ71_11945 [Bacteroidales bacterium]|nr:hypothetical protein [Bacteroidales bacterium]